MRFKSIFGYRRAVMAAAILLVLVYHIKGALPECALKKAAGYFYVGVDLFFLASGIGCYFSYRNDRDPVAFLGRRAARILPVYLPFIAVWLTQQALGEGLTLPAALANLAGVQGFLRVQPRFNWYVSGMWLSYLLTPWLAPLAARCRTRRAALAALLGLLLLTAAFWGDEEFIILVTRLPIFFVGMLLAAGSERREGLTRAELAVLLALVPLGAALLWESPRFFEDVLWSHGVAWYPMLLVAPGLYLLIAAAGEGLSRFRAGRAVNRAAAWLGGLTFEIYLVHFWALELPPLLFLPLTALFTAALRDASVLVRRLWTKKS